MTGALQAPGDDHPGTVLDALVAVLRRAGDYNPEAEVAPLAILWPDGTRQWERALPTLRDDPRLTVLTLGDYDADARTGPAIWVRAELAILPSPAPGDPPPVVYLPGHHREVFRDAEAAPAEIRPLFGLHVRGTLFLQPNGKDWTVAAFLQNARYGLGLTVDRSEATRAALGTTVKDLLPRQVAELRRHPGGIDAGFLDSILIHDMPRLVLDWLNDPAAIRAALDETTWSAFARQLHGTYRVDPDRDGPGEAARRLGESDTDPQWAVVWSRFEQSWANYPAIPDALRGAKPARAARDAVQRGIFGPAAGSGSSSHWPQDNEAAEETLRDALTALGDANASPATARQAILDLEAAHAPRRASVWAERGEAPLAGALEHLAAVARDTVDPFPAKDLATMVAHYVETGWRADAAALNALAAVRTAADREAVAAALDRIYSP